MQSAHLESKQREIDQKTYQETTRIEEEIQHRRPHDPTISSSIKYSALAGLILGIICDFVLERFGTGIIGAVLGIPLGFIVFLMRKGMYHSSLASLNAEEERRISAAKENGRIQFENEKADFIQHTKDAKTKYVRNADNIKRIIDWLFNNFSEAINEADRSDHIRTITVRYAFKVSEKEISDDNDKFDLLKNHYGYINSFVDQVGLAQALALCLRYDITRAFPSDPSDTHHHKSTKPKVEIDVSSSNDNQMVLTYVSENANYIHIDPLSTERIPG